MPFDSRPREGRVEPGSEPGPGAGAPARVLHYATGFEQPELLDEEGGRLALALEGPGRFRCEVRGGCELAFVMRDARSGEEDRPPGGGVYRLAPDLREAWLWGGALFDVEPRRLRGALVDAHTHPYRRERGDSFRFEPSALLELPGEGVKAAVTMLRGPLPEQRRRLDGLCRDHPWLVPIAWPRLGLDAPSDVEPLLEAGYRGLKFHPFLDRRPADDPAMDPFLALARRYRVPVQVHSAADDPSRPERVMALAARFPDVPVVMIHAGLGVGDRGEVLEAARALPNVYLETSWVPAEDVVAAIEAFDASRTLFGTDATVDGHGHYQHRTIGGPAGGEPINVPELLAYVASRVHRAAFVNWTLLTAVRLYRLRFAKVLDGEVGGRVERRT